jgi:hypothetical protein
MDFCLFCVQLVQGELSQAKTGFMLCTANSSKAIEEDDKDYKATLYEDGDAEDENFHHPNDFRYHGIGELSRNESTAGSIVRGNNNASGSGTLVPTQDWDDYDATGEGSSPYDNTIKCPLHLHPLLLLPEVSDKIS